MKSLNLTYIIKSPVAHVWKALTDSEVINQWGGGPSKMDSKTGTEFSLWGGDIHGTNTGVINGKLLEQDWYGGDWDEPSKVSFSITSVSSDTTKIVLSQSDIPDGEYRDIRDGWKTFYMDPLKKFLEK